MLMQNSAGEVRMHSLAQGRKPQIQESQTPSKNTNVQQQVEVRLKIISSLNLDAFEKDML